MHTATLDKSGWMDRFRLEWDRLSQGLYEADYQYLFEHTIYPFFQAQEPEAAAKVLFHRDHRNISVENVRAPGSLEAALWKMNCLHAFDNMPRTVPFDLHEAIEMLWKTQPGADPWDAVRDFVDTIQAEYDKSQATKY